MGKINELFINLLQVYVYIAVIIGMVVAYNMGNQFGGGGYAVFMYILIVPLVFGLLLIQIDNNSLLRQIRDNAKPKIKGKTTVYEDKAGSRGITSKDDVFDMRICPTCKEATPINSKKCVHCKAL